MQGGYPLFTLDTLYATLNTLYATLYAPLMLPCVRWSRLLYQPYSMNNILREVMLYATKFTLYTTLGTLYATLGTL